MLIVTYSPKYAAYQKSLRAAQIERAQSMLNSGKHKKNRKNPNDPARFINKYAVTGDGEVADIHYFLDEEKIMDIEIPPFTDEIRDLLLNKASMDFDWSEISPTIFGAVFESTLNQETRRSGGMHYTSVQNIHKVIDPLFLDDLTRELDGILYENAEMAERFRKEDEEREAASKKAFEEANKIKDEAQRQYAIEQAKAADKKAANMHAGMLRRKNTSINDLTRQLDEFQNKIAGLKFLDPACGSGNFLTESYLSLRRLENRVIEEKMNIKGQSGQMQLGDFSSDINPIKVSIQQFYGIEIHDFAATVAKTALWIAESQMLHETEQIINMNIDFLPLKSYANITEGNALRIDWNEAVPKTELNSIMGNPPFVGAKYQSKSQHEDLFLLNTGIKDIGLLDYVGGWYIKAAQMMGKESIKCAFVSTNSISQGGEPAILWKYLMNEFDTHIDFAYRTFVWDSEANAKAHVHCVIIGFSNFSDTNNKYIFYENNEKTLAYNINPYLIDSPTVLLEKRKDPISDVPKMIAGNKAVKCLALMLSEEEKNDLIDKEPDAGKYIKRMIGSDEFINSIPRYCLWLVGCSPATIKSMPHVYERVEKVREDRLSSSDKQAKKLAETPWLFRDVNNPESAIVIPLVSSQRREYIPIGYIDKETIANNKVSIIPDGTLFEFGILTSRIHNAWMRVVAMRMKSDYSYSLAIVYNNFPWPEITEKNKESIENSAKKILEARNLYPTNSLADLYDPGLMPPELRRAHKENDKEVMKAYGFSLDMSETEIVSELMKMYQDLTLKETTK